MANAAGIVMGLGITAHGGCLRHNSLHRLGVAFGQIYDTHRQMTRFKKNGAG